MKKTPKLTLRQQKFVDAYLELGNATEAAMAAGFKCSYAQGVMRYPSVKAYIAERRAALIPTTEIIDFLKSAMRGTCRPSQLRSAAAIQLGIRAGLWKSTPEAIEIIEEALKNE